MTLVERKGNEMKLYIIAGEFSGDFIGGLLISAIKEQLKSDDNIKFHGIGGKNMGNEGLRSLFPMKHINLMGFFEIIPHIFRLNKLINKTIEDIIVQNPNILITIDSPGFTYRIAKKIKEIAPHIKLVHIVAPSVWAYKPGRAKKYAQIYDHLLTLLHFEPKYFTKHGLNSTCIGHPILEQKFFTKSKELRLEALQEIDISGNVKEENVKDENMKIIAVTPGSRPGEITRHMPIIRQALDDLANLCNIKVIFVQPNESNMYNILKYLNGAKFEFGFSTNRLKIFAISDCALSKSGTNTLEISASGTPMIIGYKLNPITYFFLKMIIKVKYVSLINIIARSELIPEYIQSKFNATNICSALKELLSDDKKAKNQVVQSQEVLKSIGFNYGQSPSQIAAKIIIDMIR